MEWDVVIAGGGPNGLMLAGELALHGVRPLVLERRTGPMTEQRANGLVGQVVRMLDRRGLYARLTGTDEPPRPAPNFMFAAFPLPLHQLPDNPVYTMLVPQQRIEDVLGEWAAELGAEIRRGVEVTGFRHVDGPGVVVETSDGPVAARWLVGADGGHSPVRKLTGIDFPGVTTDDTVSRAAHVSVPPELVNPAGGLTVPGYGVIPAFLHHRTERGLISYARFPNGKQLVSVNERGVAPDGPMTIEELREAARRVLGVPLDIGPPAGDGPHLLRRGTGSNTRLADRYRAGQVLLLGDAAHVHSALGGPGLNLGLQDAVNLGWKLAAEVRGHAPEGLVDTYESERRPVAERVVMHTQAQHVLTGPGPEITALRTLFGEMLTDRAALARVADLLAGSGFTYPGAGPWAPDLTLADGTRLDELTRDGGPLLIDRGGFASRLAGRDGLADRLAGHDGAADRAAGRVRVVTDPGPGPSLMLRPDCYLAWTSDEPEEALASAITRWFVPHREVAVQHRA